MFRFLGWMLKLGLLLIILLPLTLAAISFDNSPLVLPHAATPRADDISRIKNHLKRQDPRRLPAGQVSRVTLQERDVNLLVNHTLQTFMDGYARINMRQGMVHAAMTIQLPENPIGPYINLQFSLSQLADTLSLESMVLGQVNLPTWAIQSAVDQGQKLIMQIDELAPLIESSNGFRLLNQQVVMMIQSDPQMFARLKAAGKPGMFLSDDEKERLVIYAKRLDRMAKRQPLSRHASLADVLSNLFVMAEQRTELGADPAAENKALLMALGAYLTGMNVYKLAGLPDQGRKSKRMRIRLLDRGDLAQHFGVSAALAVTGGSKLADAIGLFKELDDSAGGSGFSFPDLAADRAGVKLAETALAATSREEAIRFQQRMSAVRSEYDFMPRIDRLPEGMQSDDFKRRYGGVDGPRYQRIKGEIEKRLNQCAIYRPYA